MKYFSLILLIPVLLYFFQDEADTMLVPHEKALIRQVSKPTPKKPFASDSKIIKPLQTLPSYQPQAPQVSDVTMLEIDPAWEHELYQQLVILDQENANHIFSSYLKEKHDLEAKLLARLKFDIEKLSQLNGEYEREGEEDISGQSVSEIKSDHALKLRKIFGEHYDYIDQQHGLHRERKDSLN